MPEPQPAIPVGAALGAWSAAWVAGGLVVAPVLVVVAGGRAGDDLTIPQLALAALGSWAVFVAALVVVSRRWGSSRLLADLGCSFRRIDLIGLPLGVATQLALVPLLYVPLRSAWPDTFDADKLEERARDLADRASGSGVVLLVVVVVIGAPLVEELVYRGLVQRSVSVPLGRASGLLVTSALFSLVHLRPVEFPGLMLAGAVFGAGVVLTGRLGPAIVTHAAFNATGLVMVLLGAHLTD